MQGDLCTFREYNPRLNKYTGPQNQVTRRITYIMPGDGVIISDRFVILSLEPV